MSNLIAPGSMSATAEIAAWFRCQPNFKLRACLALHRGFQNLMRCLGVSSIDAMDKPQKTVLGTVAEHVMRSEFSLERGKGIGHRRALDYHIMGHDVDAKFSLTMGGWMIPPQVVGRPCMLIHSTDNLVFWIGLLRIEDRMLRLGANQDKKRQLRTPVLSKILWIVEEQRVADVFSSPQRPTAACPLVV